MKPHPSDVGSRVRRRGATPPDRLIRLYRRLMVIAMVLFVAGLILFSLRLYRLEQRRALEALLSQFDERVERLAAASRAIEDYVAQFADQATRFMDGGWRLAQFEETWTRMTPTPDGGGFEFPDAYWNPDGSPSGNLIATRAPQNWTESEARMAALGIAMQSYQQAGHRARRNIVLSYFFSSGREILSLYPHVPASGFLKTTASNDLATALDHAWEPYAASVSESADLDGGFWTVPYEDRAGHGMMVSRVDPIHMGDTFVGLVGADVTLELLKDYVAPLGGPAGVLGLSTNSGGVMVRTEGPNLTGVELETLRGIILPHLSEDPDVETPGLILTGGGFWVLIDGVPGMAWTMIYAVRYSDLSAWLFQERFSLILIVVAVVAFLVAGFILISRRFVRPALKAEQALLDALQREAELATLRSQINPHFLFNSLNTVRALVRTQPDQARDAVTRLSNILRVALETGKRSVIPLEVEMKVVRSYLALEALRFDERMVVEIDQEEGLDEARVPPMLIQTLVENAVKHGAGAQGGGCAVDLHIRVEAGVLVVTVTNPGRIRSGSRSTRVGLRNARERLDLLFGEEGALTLEETADGRVRAEARFPLVIGSDGVAEKSR